MDNKRRIQELLDAISSDEKYGGCVFEGGGLYFIIGNGEIIGFSDDAGCTPRGGWFPDIISGPTAEEDKCLTDMMEKLDFDEYYFSDVIDDYSDFDEEYILECLEDDEDEETLKIYKKIKKKVESGKTPFETMDDFMNALGRYGLESNGLYYEWEGEYIDLYENICETGTALEEFDNEDEEMWIRILENIDDHIVRR